MELGKAGKLSTVEIRYYHVDTNQVCLHRLHNFTSQNIMDMRNAIFTAGLMLSIDPGHQVIIPPSDIRTVDVYRQKSYIQ